MWHRNSMEWKRFLYCGVAILLYLGHLPSVEAGHLHRHLQYKYPKHNSRQDLRDSPNLPAFIAARDEPVYARSELNSWQHDILGILRRIWEELQEIRSSLGLGSPEQTPPSPSLPWATQPVASSSKTEARIQPSAPGVTLTSPCCTTNLLSTKNSILTSKTSGADKSAHIPPPVSSTKSHPLHKTKTLTTDETTTLTTTRTTTITLTLQSMAPSFIPSVAPILTSTWSSSTWTSHTPLSLEPSFTTPSSIIPSYTSTVSTVTPTSTFNPEASNNIAVYYGQSVGASYIDLEVICANPAVGIVNLAFVYEYFDQYGMPTVSFGPACGGPSTAQSAEAPGLLDCPLLAQQIEYCQQAGKLVQVSLGGYISNSSFPSAEKAKEFASTIWNLFAGGTEKYQDLRPFGRDVVVDGFDVDNEDHSTLYYDAFAHELLRLYAQEAVNRKFYLTATPQCPRPDASVPEGLMKSADFVFVQFYNNPSCNLDSAGFVDSFAAWSQDLASGETYGTGPKLYVGMGAWPGAGSGFVEGSELGGVISQAKAVAQGNFGGIMMWDGSEAILNTDYGGQNYLDYAAAAVQ